MEIISRSEAKTLGLTRFFTGEPCKYGHIVERQTCNGGCSQCSDEKSKRWHADNPEKVKEKGKRWADNHPEKVAQKKVNFKASNPDYFKDHIRDWRLRNPGRSKIISRNWLVNNRDKANARTNRRKAMKLQAIPVWANKKKINALYAEAARLTAETGIEHHVDHYYPLRGEICCGLHVETNLQIITADENHRKGNKMPEDFYL